MFQEAAVFSGICEAEGELVLFPDSALLSRGIEPARALI